MLHKIAAIVLVLALIVLSSACRKTEFRTVVPDCINKKIDQFNLTSGCDDSSVDMYAFQYQRVYVFRMGSCGNDFVSEVMSENCSSLGFLGGFRGVWCDY